MIYPLNPHLVTQNPRHSAPVDPKTAKNRVLQTYKQIQMSSGRLIFPPEDIHIIVIYTLNVSKCPQPP